MLLDLIEDYVRLSGYTYERLDGGITGDRRQAAIDLLARLHHHQHEHHHHQQH